MRKLYLDVDGVLLTRKNVRMADGAIEFIDYALSNFDCYWLTTHCRTNDTCNILKYLSEFIPLDTIDKLAVVKPSLWDTGKTEGIDFNSDFYWLDDFLFEFEKITLEKHYRLNRMIKVNLENHGELKRIQNLAATLSGTEDDEVQAFPCKIEGDTIGIIRKTFTDIGHIRIADLAITVDISEVRGSILFYAVINISADIPDWLPNFKYRFVRIVAA